MYIITHYLYSVCQKEASIYFEQRHIWLAVQQMWLGQCPNIRWDSGELRAARSGQGGEKLDLTLQLGEQHHHHHHHHHLLNRDHHLGDHHRALAKPRVCLSARFVQTFNGFWLLLQSLREATNWFYWFFNWSVPKMTRYWKVGLGLG